MIELRPYQLEAKQAVRDYWLNDGGNPLVEMATGTGKSVVIGAMTKDLLTEFPNIRMIMLVHVRELVEQNAMALLRQWPQAPLGINSAGLGRRDRYSQILFASIQSVWRMADQIGPRDVVMIDECHLIPRDGSGMYRTTIEKLRHAIPDLRVVGFTATPYRLDSGRQDEGDDRLFDDVVYSYDLARGVADGFLSPLVSRATVTEIDVRGVARRGGEFVPGALEAAADKIDVVQGAANEIVQLGESRKSWLAFCSGVAHAAHVRDALRERGISAEMVTGETPNGERDRIIRGFRAGQIRCLTNAMVLTTGFDVPQVDLIAMLRPTLSTGLYVQTLGRGTRLADGKSNCLVLDFAGNVRRHGPVDAVSITTKKKDGREKPEKTDPDTVRAKVCPVCQTYNDLLALTCISCGHVWPLPTPRHGAVAEAAPIMTSELKDRWLPVSDVHLDRHLKYGDGPDSLVVTYDVGLQCYKEWVCIEHRGFPRGRAEAWWRSMGGKAPVPATIDEAMARAIELDIACAITIARQDKYWKVAGRRVERPDGRLVEVDNFFRVSLVTKQEAAA